MHVAWNVDFALVDERGKNRLQEESNELGALTWKLRLGDDEISIKIYIQMKGEEIIEIEMRTNELVDVALGIKYAQGFDLYAGLHSVDVDDVAPPTVKFSDAKHHVSLLSIFLSNKSLHFGINEIINIKKINTEFR